jgi:hypothetical protein
MTKKKPKCQYKDCKKHSRNKDIYCNRHASKVTINRFLSRVYYKMRRRTQGKDTNTPHLYINKPLLNKEVFFTWSRNHPEFLRLYKTWLNCDLDRKLVPSVNRLTSGRGYTLDNMEWVTSSTNSKLACTVRDLNHKKEVYKLLKIGRNSNEKNKKTKKT